MHFKHHRIAACIDDDNNIHRHNNNDGVGNDHESSMCIALALVFDAMGGPQLILPHFINMHGYFCMHCMIAKH